jgi:organic hydroperoxide reductase OsmC/OhrA
MPGKTHRFATTLRWTGNRGTGTSGYKDYARTHEIAATGKPIIPGSADPVFRGDADRYNPEDLLIGAISSCHMLWYLHLCAVAKVVVVAYEDDADGQMVEDAGGGGRFVSATIRPRVTLAPGSNVEKARALHHDAHVKCFIANSLNFPVAVEPSFATA